MFDPNSQHKTWVSVRKHLHHLNLGPDLTIFRHIFTFLNYKRITLSANIKKNCLFIGILVSIICSMSNKQLKQLTRNFIAFIDSCEI